MNENNGEINSPSLFREAISKVAVAQICQSIGFSGSQHSALEALSNIATRYMRALGKSASSNAGFFGRTECNLFDVIHAIEEMNSVHGFRGASDINRPILDSTVIGDIMSFVSCVDEIPFAKPIPRCNTGKRSRLSLPLSKPRKVNGQNSDFSHIPPWLPAFPDPSTYKKIEIRVQSEVGRDGNEEKNDSRTNRVVDVKRCNIEEKRRVLPAVRPKVRFKMESGVGFGVKVKLVNDSCRRQRDVEDCNGTVDRARSGQ